jgi:hypothetical protein
MITIEMLLDNFNDFIHPMDILNRHQLMCPMCDSISIPSFENDLQCTQCDFHYVIAEVGQNRLLTQIVNSV